MPEWKWSDRAWRERVESNPEELIKEALRRAVDIRDQGFTPRAVALVDVLNALCALMKIDVENLWVL